MPRNTTPSIVRVKTAQCGAVIVETAITLAFLLLLVLLSIDLFFVSSSYMSYSQIAREGVVQGTSMKDLFLIDAGSCDGSDFTNLQSGNGIYSSCGSTPASCGHFLVHWRLLKTLRANNFLKLSNTLITTRCFDRGTVPRELEFEVQLNATFNGDSPIFKNMPIVVRQRGQIVQ